MKEIEVQYLVGAVGEVRGRCVVPSECPFASLRKRMNTRDQWPGRAGQVEVHLQLELNQRSPQCNPNPMEELAMHHRDARMLMTCLLGISEDAHM